MISVIDENDPVYELCKNDLFIDEECFSMLCTHRKTNNDNDKSIFIVTTTPRDLKNENNSYITSKDLLKDKYIPHFIETINLIKFSLNSNIKINVNNHGIFTFILNDEDDCEILKYILYISEKDDEKEFIWWIQHHTKWQITLYNN